MLDTPLQTDSRFSSNGIRNSFVASINNMENDKIVENKSSPVIPGKASSSTVHPARRALIEMEFRSNPALGSTSFDKQTEMHSRPGLDVADSSNGRSGGTSLSMDKISTMTLADFKSLLSSSLSINEEQNSPSPGSDAALKGRRASVQNSRGEVYMDTASSSLGLGRLAGIGSQPQSPDDASEDSLSTFGSNRPKTPKVLRRSSEALITAETSQPKLPTALSRPKTPKMFSDQERSTSKEEYKMARPKPVSQIKSEASAKVAGAISNLVQAKQDVGATDYNKPKIPARPQTLVGPGGNQSQKLQQENFEDFADPDPSTAITSTARERPVTPSRIPKPSFIPRPTTPKMQSSLAAELSRELSSPVNLLPQQCSTSNLTKLNIMSINRPPGLSRSSSNSSSVKSMDETPVSPASSFSEDRPFKSYSRHRRLSNSSDGFSANSGNANSSCNNSSRSYKDIYTAKKAALSGSENRHPPPTRAVTPGPREKWTLGGHSVESAGHSSNHRRRSINTNCLVDKHTMQKPNIATTQTRRSSNTSNTEADQQMVITNEITFSDDEEINELIKTAAFNAATSNTRSLSVDVSKNTQRKMKGGDEVLMITRQKGDSANKFNVIRRTESRGSSKDRASPALKTFRSITPNSAMFQHKISSAVKGKESVDVNSGMSISQPNNKGLTRTEAWVDSTVPDSKRKPLPRPRRKTGIGNEISVSELASRPLEEIQAILAEPKNGFVHVDSKSLDAPPEDPEMFRKMEKLFEKYREMELKASSNDTSSSSAGKPASVKSSDAVAFGKCENKVLGSGVARPSTSLKLLKSSSGSFMSTSVHSPGSLNDCPVGGRIPSNENSRLTGISMGPIHNQQQRFSSNSSSMIESPQEFLDMGSSSHSEAFSQGLQTSSDQKRLEALQDIDSEVAKNPAALIFKIKEILKVRPRKDENTKVPTRIPAPAVLNKYSRSKSVSNLFSDDLSSSNTCSSHEFLVAQAGSKNVLNSVNLDPSNDDQSKSNTRISAVISSHSSESTNRGDPADEVPELTRTWSVQSDSSDSQNRSETPAPKLATPLTTGRSTLISRRGEKLGRGLSQEKENNLSNSQTANLSALSTAEDGSEFV